MKQLKTPYFFWGDKRKLASAHKDATGNHSIQAPRSKWRMLSLKTKLANFGRFFQSGPLIRHIWGICRVNTWLFCVILRFFDALFTQIKIYFNGFSDFWGIPSMSLQLCFYFVFLCEEFPIFCRGISVFPNFQPYFLTLWL